MWVLKKKKATSLRSCLVSLTCMRTTTCPECLPGCPPSPDSWSFLEGSTPGVSSSPAQLHHGPAVSVLNTDRTMSISRLGCVSGSMAFWTWFLPSGRLPAFSRPPRPLLGSLGVCIPSHVHGCLPLSCVSSHLPSHLPTQAWSDAPAAPTMPSDSTAF